MKVAMQNILPPLTGLVLLLTVNPRLAPWAAVYRRYAANQ